MNEDETLPPLTSLAKPEPSGSAGSNRTLRLAVGYRNSADVEALRSWLEPTDIRLISYDQSAQRLYDNAIRLEADCVLLSPDCEGYRHEIVSDLLFARGKPVPVIGWIDPRTDDGQGMMAHGAKGYISLPMDAQQSSRLYQLIHEVVQAALRERDEGRVSLGYGRVNASGRGNSFASKVIAVYVPKGGGSHRSTTALNLATALSHVTLGNQRTMLLDFDQTKGDLHTMLGYCLHLEPAIAIRHDMFVIERGLKDLMTAVASRPNADVTRTVSLPLIKNYMIESPALAESQLDLLPGILRPADAGSEVFRNERLVLEVAREIIRQVSRAYMFTLIDIGQDFNAPLHEAALTEADDILIVVPPTMTAVMDTRFALQSMRQYFGDLTKCKLLITGYEPNLGLTEAQIVELLELPLAGTLPFDHVVAHQAINSHTPYVLTDGGPLGTAMRKLAGMYLPELSEDPKRQRSQRGFRINLKSLFVRAA
ncbi:MAG: AAA family ATPase [Chloroflexi bacterium]|nr:AAA family ATPase [Chloroflexota bacterium]